MTKSISVKWAWSVWHFMAKSWAAASGREMSSVSAELAQRLSTTLQRENARAVLRRSVAPVIYQYPKSKSCLVWLSRFVFAAPAVWRCHVCWQYRQQRTMWAVTLFECVGQSAQVHLQIWGLHLFFKLLESGLEVGEPQCVQKNIRC